MRTSPEALIAILGMAFVTYLTRAGGLWLMNHVQISKRVKTWLEYLPGAVIVAIVAPAVSSSGPVEIGAALVTIIVAIRTHSMLLSMIIGLVVLCGLRLLFIHAS